MPLNITLPRNNGWIDLSVKYVVELEESDSTVNKITAYILMIFGTVLLGLSIIGIPILIKALITYGEERTFIKYQKLLYENTLLQDIFLKTKELTSAAYKRGCELLSKTWTETAPQRLDLLQNGAAVAKKAQEALLYSLENGPSFIVEKSMNGYRWTKETLSPLPSMASVTHSYFSSFIGSWLPSSKEE